MGPKQLEVTVVYGAPHYECEKECGVDWSGAEMAELLRDRVRERFGERVSVRFIKATGAGKAEPRATLLIDGQPRIYGQLDIRRLLDAIDAELEIKGGGRADD